MRPLRPLILILALALAGSAASTYRIRAGDTLGGIARRLGVPIGQLAAANGIANPNRIYAGQTLSLPGAGAPAAPGPAFVAGRGPGTYVVRPGDTLSAIAARHGTTVAQLVKANGIRNPNLVRIGQHLAVSGGWVCPVKGAYRFTNDYGFVRSGGRRHEGNDLFAARGTPVVANVSGQFDHSVGARAGWGYYLRGDDGHTYYGAHLDRYARGPGRVAAGEMIGVVGNTGNAIGSSPHLHFEIKPHGGPPVNPFPTLQRYCPL